MPPAEGGGMEIIMKNSRVKGNLMLLITATIWGVAFVAQSVGMDYVGPFTFNGVRFLIGGIILIPCSFILQKYDNKKEFVEDKKKLYIGGLLCGILMFGATSFQQFGILYTSVGKTGFITALYVILVPIMGILIKRKVRFTIWIGAVIAVAGFYLLCINEGFSIAFGDILVFVCAIFFALHIMVVDYFVPYVNGVKLSCIQFIVAGIISSICMFIFEKPEIGSICSAWQPILYAGILSCGVAYTLQIIGQKYTNPFLASLILSLESVISVLAGWLILGEVLSAKELIGCGLVFVAILIAQWPEKKAND